MNYLSEIEDLGMIAKLCNEGELTKELFASLREHEYLFLHFPECTDFLREEKCPPGFLKRVELEAKYFGNLLKKIQAKDGTTGE